MTEPPKEVALVTGAASGIGRAIALRLSLRGALVGLVDRNQSGLEESAKQIASATGACEIMPADVTDEQSLSNVITRFAAPNGGLDTVVSAAGVAKEGLVHKFPKADWDQVISVNLTGTFLVAHYSVPWLLKRSSTSFTAISSDAGVQGATGYAAYCASKHGVIGLIKCMALDYGRRGLRSNAICPAFVETPMADQIFGRAPEGTKEFFQNSVPIGRFARPEEVANVVAHLSSPEASYSNGMNYVIDGGSTAGYYVAES